MIHGVIVVAGKTLTLKPSATASFSDKEFVTWWDVHRTGQWSVCITGRNGNSVNRNPVEEIGGSVNRVHHPGDSRGAGFLGPLLTEEAVVGAQLSKHCGDEVLALSIPLGDHVSRGGFGVDGTETTPPSSGNGVSNSDGDTGCHVY
jgi:hypothetical protein